MTSLKLALKPASTAPFAAALSQLSSLRQLDISTSRFEPRDSHDVAKSLSALVNLEVLRRAHAGVYREVVPTLASSPAPRVHAAVCRHVLELSNRVLCDVPLSEGEGEGCVLALAHLPALTQLKLDGSVSSRECDALQGQCWVRADRSIGKW